MDNRIHLLLRCTKKIYAKEMMEQGGIFFNYPIIWIKMGEKGDIGQGDPLEGVYAEDIEDNDNLRADSELSKTVKGKSYLRSKSIVNNWLCTCFFSVSDWTLQKKEDGSLGSTLDQKYIEAFNNGHKQEPLFEADNDKMAAVVINDPKTFLHRIRQHFIEKHNLVENEDFFMGLVNYRNDEAEFHPIKRPYELFSKSEEYIYQQEYRIVLNPESPKVIAMLNGEQKIYIGSLKDCAFMRPYFYDGASMVVDLLSEKINISRWEGLTERPLHMWKFEHLATILLFTLNWDIKCILDGKEVNGLYLRKEIDKVLMYKYRTFVNYKIYTKGTDRLTFLNPRGMEPETILKNENMDLYYYLRNNNMEFISPIFEKLGIIETSGVKWYWPLVYQDKITSPINSILAKRD